MLILWPMSVIRLIHFSLKMLLSCTVDDISIHFMYFVFSWIYFVLVLVCFLAIVGNYHGYSCGGSGMECINTNPSWMESLKSLAQ